MQKKKKKVIHKGNYQWSLCAIHRNLVTIEGNTWPVAKNIEYSSIRNTKIIWKSTITLCDWFLLKTQCFNIYNSYAPWNARPLLLLYYFIQKCVSFVLLNWKLRFVKGMSLLWVYFKFKTVILCYLDSVSDEWLMVTIPPVFRASFLGKRVVKKFKFWWLTYWHFVLLKNIIPYTLISLKYQLETSSQLTWLSIFFQGQHVDCPNWVYSDPGRP